MLPPPPQKSKKVTPPPCKNYDFPNRIIVQLNLSGFIRFRVQLHFLSCLQSLPLFGSVPWMITLNTTTTGTQWPMRLPGKFPQTTQGTSSCTKSMKRKWQSWKKRAKLSPHPKQHPVEQNSECRSLISKVSIQSFVV